jgi:hypothetical protein
VTPKKLISVKAEPADYAWWLRLNFTPSQTSVDNISVKEISKDWCNANAFSKKDYMQILSKDAATDFANNPHIAFSVTGKYDGRRYLRAVSGVYQKCSGEQGNFVLLVEPESKKMVSVLEINQQRAGFMTLANQENNLLQVAWCLECDFISLLKWSPTLKNLELDNLAEAE